MRHGPVTALMLISLSSWCAGCGDSPADVRQDTSDVSSPDVPPGDAPAGDAPGDVDISPPLGPQPLYVHSSPSEYAFVGLEYRYRPRVSGVGTPALELLEAPDGMTVSADGRLRWTPGPEQIGAVRVRLRATLGDATATQAYRVEVRAVTTFAEETIGSAGGSVGAHVAPEGLDGAALVLPPGAVEEDTRLALGVLSEPLVVPGLSPDAPTRQLVLGPPGTAFHKPFVLHLPYPPELAAEVSELAVFVLDERSGAWGTAEVIGHDPERHTLFVESTHFSVYVVAQPVLTTALTLYDLGGLDGCQESLASHAVLEQPLSVVPVTSVRQLEPDIYEAAVASGEALDIAALVKHPRFHGSLQVRVNHTFAFRADEDARRRWTMRHLSVHVTLFAPGDGTASLAVARGGQQATPAWIRRDLDLHADWMEIDAILRGASSYARIGTSHWSSVTSPQIEYTVFKDLTVKPIFVHLPGDATEQSFDGASHAHENGLPGRAFTKGPASVPQASPDTDCDGIDDAIQDELGAGLTVLGTPEQTVHVTVGEAVSLECVTHGGASGDTLAWSANATSATLTNVSSDQNTSTAELVATEPGLHLVTCALPEAMGGASRQFAIEAHAPDPALEPPPCILATSADSGPAGSTLALAGAAGPSELEADARVIRWGLLVAGALQPSELVSPAEGPDATFAPEETGTYTVGCQVFRGSVGGPIGEATIEVLPEAANHAPVGYWASPAAAIVAPGQPLTLGASALDPDEDPLTFSWEPAALVQETGSLQVGQVAKSEAVFIADVPGHYEVAVRVSDGHHPAQVRVLKVSVLADGTGSLAVALPDEVAFPTTEVGAEARTSIWLRNVGTVPIAWTSSVSGAGFESGAFSGTLNPNSSIGPLVRFVPPAVGSFEGVFTYTYEGVTIDVPLHGEGVAPDEVCDGDDCEPCVASCDGANCGDDGCGGSCGTCPAGSVCSGMTCVADPCEGVTCPPGERCDDGVCLIDDCEPRCGNANCGDDGCGGTCGSCFDGEVCVVGECRADLPECLPGQCATPEPTCDGQARVALSVAGCLDDACYFFEDREDCASLGQICAAGACQVAPGLAHIEAGIFTRGSPFGELGRFSWEIQHEVTLTRGFMMQTTEVTQGQWKALSGGVNPSSDSTCGDECPVDSVDWFSALAFANTLSLAGGFEPCFALTGCEDPVDGWKDGAHSGCTGATFSGLDCTGFRLPTEAEWEYAARAGTATATYRGDLSAEGCEDSTLLPIAWYCGNSGGEVWPVATKEPNAWGLYDMLGNVWEWTWDPYGDYTTSPLTDPLGSSSPSHPPELHRVARGGSWFSEAELARAAHRGGLVRSHRSSALGFRLCRTVPD